MVKRFLIIFFVLCATQSNAQYEQMAGVFVPPDSTKEFTLFFRFSRAQSSVEQKSVVFNSLRGGFEINKKFRTGLLVASMGDSLILKDNLPEGAEYNVVGLAAIGGFFEFMVINNYRWEMSVPVQLGYGFASYTYLDGSKEELFEEDVPYYFFSELGFNFQYNFNNWAGFGVGLGVRTTSAGHESVSKYTRGPFYNLGLRFSVGGLYSSVFHKQEVQAKKKAYFELREKVKAKKKWR